MTPGEPGFYLVQRRDGLGRPETALNLVHTHPPLHPAFPDYADWPVGTTPTHTTLHLLLPCPARDLNLVTINLQPDPGQPVPIPFHPDNRLITHALPRPQATTRYRWQLISTATTHHTPWSVPIDPRITTAVPQPFPAI